MTLSADRRRLLAKMLAEKAVRAPGASRVIARGGEAQECPLTFAQEALWFVDQLDPECAAHNVPCAVRLRGQVDIAALEWSLNEIVRRHESLRTTFGSHAGRPYQVVHESCPLELEVADLSELDATAAGEQAHRLATAEAHKPFDLEQGPLIRAILIRLAAAEQILVLNFHHLVTDGWSMGVFTRELDQLYAGRLCGEKPALHEPSIRMSDVAGWQRERMQGDELERHLSYWREKVGTGLPVLALPVDHSRPPVSSFRGLHQAVNVPAALSDEVRALARRHGVTTFMTLMAVFLAVLHQRTGQEDIVVGSAIADRDRPQLEDIIGFLVNMLVFRTDLSGNPAFPELLRRVRDTTLGAYTHKDLPLTRLVREAQPERDLSRMPLFQVEFSLLTPEENPAVYGYGLGAGVTQTSELLGMPATTFPVHYNNARYDIAVFLWDLPAGITGTLEYSSDLFEAATIRALVEDFVLALKFVAEQPGATLDRLVGELKAAAANRQSKVEDRYRASMRSGLASLRRGKSGQSGGSKSR
jgi:hypothetical protein